ncbi:two-component system sensor histidine kinase KdpD [Thiobacillus sp.]|uniref:two-component system sensor histidine kinase KdpD n=1 Tax=Thiobacillus sp. TaxID=924 RepID=UPI0025D070E2|nr:two-component system sensor histidine kinase KdpD [Thiobacillus sp.]MBT9540306.1 two-component system sensor histidine kinase KdpD [Thiobacillus sp.]
MTANDLDNRPDPDTLLARIEAEAERAKKGKLRIFFGACPGVGKTYAMLSAARMLHEQGSEVVVGVVETHGRSETARLVEGLELLPPKLVAYQGRELREFDLDAALARKPALILVDELAHSNVAGSRHPKRWQDVEELLAAGIDVWTTVNVQHLESLNDIVGGITGIQVRETLPDRVFEQADEVALVDLPPDELLQRMKEGKVYLAQQAERAIRNFFRKGNLIALRELALRRTADRVDAQMREYRTDQAIETVWQAKERLLVCVGPGAGGDRLVRSAARLAGDLHADWIAVYVETPALQRLSDANRDKILKTLALARELGAETATLAGQEDAQTLLAYAISRNASKLVVGKSLRTGLSRMLRAPLSDRLSALARDVDVYVVAHEVEAAPAGEVVAMPLELELEPARGWKVQGYAWAGGICALTTVLAKLVLPWFDLANLIMFYLVGVIWVAASYGRGPAILGSILSVLAFDFFFVPPPLSFTVADTRHLLTFFIMLAVGLTISTLAANLRYQARIATYRERRTRALNELGKELAGALMAEQIVETARHHLESLFQAKVCILLPDADETLRSPTPLPTHKDLPLDPAIAQWVYDHQQPAGMGTQSLAGHPMYYLPLKAPMRTRGVLALLPSQKRLLFLPEQARMLETLSGQIALALERVHFVEVAQDALVRMESERLRNGLLSALSHDLRTPLTVLAGLADSLPLAGPPLPEAQAEIAQAIRAEALRTSILVSNLLDMARLQEGQVQLKREWQPLEEVVGASLQTLAVPLARHEVVVDLPADLPLLEFDSVLMERVLCNLLENAAKYTPPGSRIEIGARNEGDRVSISVADNGPGLPPGREDMLFEKFTRGQDESAVAGVGLGLAIVRAIVEAHKGTVRGETRAEGGARFVISLPAGEPPVVPPETSA